MSADGVGHGSTGNGVGVPALADGGGGGVHGVRVDIPPVGQPGAGGGGGGAMGSSVGGSPAPSVGGTEEPRRGRGRPRGSLSGPRGGGAGRGRGRGRGGAAGGAVGGRQSVAELGAEAGEDDGEMLEGAEDGEKKKSRREIVELEFAELNRSVPHVRTGRAANGCVTFVTQGVIPEHYAESTFPPVLVEREVCSPLGSHMATMASASMCWRTVQDTWVDGVLPCARNTGPCLSICRQNHTPNMPDDFKEMAYLVACVNCMPSLNGCAVPTPDTRLKWSADYQTVVGLRMRQTTLEERFRQQQAVGQQARAPRTFLGIRMPDADGMTYGRDDAMDEEAFVSCNPLVFVVSIVPVFYLLDGEERKDTFWIGTVIPQPGVDVVRCFEKLGKPLNATQGLDIKVAADRRDRWMHLNYVEPFQSYKLQVQEWDHVLAPGTADNLTDRRHAYLVMNPTSVVHKIIQALPNGVEECQMVGLPAICEEVDVDRMYANHLANWHMCIAWSQEFWKLWEAIQATRGSDRRFIPPLNLPVVPGTPFRGRDDPDTYYSILGTPPLNMLWKPMLEFDTRLSYEEFCIGRLPILVQGTLMSWIFDGDIHEFLGVETEVLTEDKVFEKYYRDKNSALN
eukprot:3933901-Rhodomonas_salina.1